MGSAVPVLLCLVDNVEREGYFVCLNDYVDKILISQNQIMIGREQLLLIFQ